MKCTSDIVSTLHHLRIAQMHMDSFMNERKNAVLTGIFRAGKNKINWIFNELKAHPLIPQIVRDGINQEINSDVLAPSAIYEKIALLSPQKREAMEALIEELLNDNEIEVEVR
jgi:hypothetical protein